MRRLHDLWRRGRRAARTATPDAELLDRFVRHGDHAAFAELVDRLGPLVYGTCRRLLPNPADVEDAFQATFLVLVRRAESLAGRSVGPWLHRVAQWTARGFRRRNAVAARHDDRPPSGSSSAFDATDARLDIDAAVSALPEKYRVAVILCHLQGWTRGELAAHLGCPESTASSLVGRGLARLKKRLAGHDPAVVLAVAGAAAVPPGLAASAVRAADLYRTSSLSAAASPAVAELTEGVLRMFRMKKLAAGAAAAVLVVGIGFGLALGTGPRADAQAPKSLQPADARTEREKLDRDIAVAKERLKQLEAQKDQLQKLDELRAQEKVQRLYSDLLDNAREAVAEPYIGLWVRQPGGTAQLPGRDATATATAELLRYNIAAAGGGSRSEFAINEIYGKGKPVVEVHFYSVHSLQVYLTRAAKDPTAPKKMKLYIDKDYPWSKAKTVIDACKAAGFGAIELASAPLPPAAPAKAALPPYVIEAPDVLTIEAIVRSGDQTHPLPTQSLSGQFPVRPDGTVGLGFFGSVSVTGLTIDQATEAIRKHLLDHKLLREKAVRPESLAVAVDVLAYNSKRYYVITEGKDGEEARPFPVTGNETILDAVAQVPGLSNVAVGSNVWIARATKAAGEPWQILPVDWKGIVEQGVTTTNYQIMPGDRIYVKSKK